MQAYPKQRTFEIHMQLRPTGGAYMCDVSWLAVGGANGGF